MKEVIDRSGWSLKRKILQDLKHFPLFLVGMAPRYKGEWSGYFEGDPVDPMHGGWSIYMAIVTITVAILSATSIATIHPETFQVATTAEGIFACIFLPVGMMFFLLIGWLAATIAQIPFMLLNGAIEAFSAKSKTDG